MSPWRLGHRPLFSGARLLAVAAFVLILSPTAASGSRAMSSAQVTLTVSIAGTGSGLITSYPAPLTYDKGISCPSTCSAEFADGTLVDLHVQTDARTSFGGFSTSPPYRCDPVYVPVPAPGTDDCTIQLDSQVGSTASVQVTLNRMHLVCAVPSLEGRTLARAKALIRGSHCAVGKVKHAFSGNVKRGRVISENPRAHSHREQGAKVNLVVSKGRR